jgi:hypothetical protein
MYKVEVQTNTTPGFPASKMQIGDIIYCERLNGHLLRIYDMFVVIEEPLKTYCVGNVGGFAGRKLQPGDKVTLTVQ